MNAAENIFLFLKTAIRLLNHLGAVAGSQDHMTGLLIGKLGTEN